MNLFKAMKVLITQSRDKERGQSATVLTTQSATIFLKLLNEKIVEVHTVTTSNIIL